MKSREWYIFGLLFVGLSSFFITIDNHHEEVCYLDPTPQLTKSFIISCINAEIFDPFVWILYPVGIICLVLGIMNGKPKK